MRQRRHFRVRKKVSGTAERPRLTVFRSSMHIYCQVIDDSAGRTLACADTRGPAKGTGNCAAAGRVGTQIAEKVLGLGLKKVVFDRSGYMYHGRVKALAEAARKAGLEF
ncbi:MAG TPA: 50S ribosomal protein L18 [Candidatus Brocadiia bacterium]|nr:50S ribosomal protein L18 [Candidatus Brocadiia bacterium]